MPFQPAEQPVSLADLGVMQEIGDEVTDGELTPEQEQELAEMVAQTPDLALQDEEKRLAGLVETLEASEEQKAELRHQIRFLFFSTSAVTVFLMMGSFVEMSRPLLDGTEAGPPIFYVAVATILSYLTSIGILNFSEYGEAKQKLQETEQQLMDFATLMDITSDSPKEILLKTRAKGNSHRQALRAKRLSLELSQKKKK